MTRTDYIPTPKPIRLFQAFAGLCFVSLTSQVFAAGPDDFTTTIQISPCQRLLDESQPPLAAQRNLVGINKNHEYCVLIQRALSSPGAMRDHVEYLLSNYSDTETARRFLVVMDHMMAQPAFVDFWRSHSRAVAFLDRSSGAELLSAHAMMDEYLKGHRAILAQAAALNIAGGQAAGTLRTQMQTVLPDIALTDGKKIQHPLLTDIMAPLGLTVMIDPEILRNLVDAPVEFIRELFVQWSVKLSAFGRNLLVTLLILGFIITGWGMIFGSLDPVDFVKQTFQLVLVAIIFLFLMMPFTYIRDGKTTTEPMITRFTMDWMSYLSESVRSAACEDAISDPTLQINNMNTTGLCIDKTNTEKQSSFAAGDVAVRGLQKANELIRVLDNARANKTWIGSALMAPMYIIGGIAFLVVSILYLVMAAMVALIWIEGYMVLAFGIFVLAFGAVPIFKEKAMAYIWFALGWTVRIATMMMVFYFVDTAFEQALQSNEEIGKLLDNADSAEIYFGPFLILCVAYMMTPFFTTLLMHTISNKVAGFVGGGSSETGSQMVGLSKQILSLGINQVVGTAARGAKGAFVNAPGAVAGTTRGIKGMAEARGEGAGRWQSVKQGVRSMKKSEDAAAARAPAGNGGGTRAPAGDGGGDDGGGNN